MRRFRVNKQTNLGAVGDALERRRRFQGHCRWHINSVQFIVNRHDLAIKYGLGLYELLDALRETRDRFDRFDRFLSSIEHLAFYLRYNQSEGIKNPKDWILSKLREGYYPAPAGYVPWQIQRAVAQQRDAEERVREIKKRQFLVDCELWLLRKTHEERRRLLAEGLFKTPNSVAAQEYLRQRFCEETGRLDPRAGEQEAAGSRTAHRPADTHHRHAAEAAPADSSHRSRAAAAAERSSTQAPRDSRSHRV